MAQRQSGASTRIDSKKYTRSIFPMLTSVRFNNSQFLKQLKNVKCRVPYTEYHIYMGGNVSNCCFSWLPTHVGNINKTSLKDIIANDLSQQIRSSVENGDYSFCNSETCPALNTYLYRGDLPEFSPLKPINSEIQNRELLIFLDYDQSCNLYCESCRHQRILYTKENIPADLRQTHENAARQIDELIQDGYKINLNLCGSGDLFASELYWQYLREMPADYPVNLFLITNGILLTEERLHYPYADKIRQLSISIDAATDETYACVRRGGKLSVVHKNLSKIDYLIRTGHFENPPSIEVSFVVQQMNYREIATFAEQMLQYSSVRRVWYNLIADWGHLTPESFRQKAVWAHDHPEHSDFLAVLKNPVLKNERVFLGNMSKYTVE